MLPITVAAPSFDPRFPYEAGLTAKGAAPERGMHAAVIEAR
ncbi:hypothetical protein OG889_12680 [Streptomyces sp. NBC_00481]|nr:MULTISPECIES: hypothetical protein [unclassified Streptomyces]WRY95510.1 hypothetical protein OG889_12680 [Streptomyces sp. NBC_00481]